MKHIHCKFCDTYLKDYDHYAAHMEKKHNNLIPIGMDGWQFIYYLRTNKTHGNCIMCKKPTDWNQKTHKYQRFCNNPKCKDSYRNIFKERMIGKYGKVTLLNDPEQQRIMLANRKISGTYNWSDHVHTSTYTGSYELSFLEFLDLIMNFDPEDVMSPSPHTYYYIYENTRHFYIPDFFIPSLNLEVEIKEGTNNHPKNITVDRVKEQLKDEVMVSNGSSFNYLKIREKNNARFITYLEEAKKRFVEGREKKPIIML